jgi:hypothetical protein
MFSERMGTESNSDALGLDPLRSSPGDSLGSQDDIHTSRTNCQNKEFDLPFSTSSVWANNNTIFDVEILTNPS